MSFACPGITHCSNCHRPLGENEYGLCKNCKEKQNKEELEIEEKDELLKFNKNYINRLEQDLFENASNYVVPKEKIREKIKELKDNRPYLSKFDDWKEKEYTNEDINNMCVEVLEDLLGDE